MNFDVLKFLTPYSLCVSAPLREINHPAIMQRLILLCGGDKSTQEQDIVKAQEYWKDYRSRDNA